MTSRTCTDFIIGIRNQHNFPIERHYFIFFSHVQHCYRFEIARRTGTSDVTSQCIYLKRIKNQTDYLSILSNCSMHQRSSLFERNKCIADFCKSFEIQSICTLVFFCVIYRNCFASVWTHSHTYGNKMILCEANE